MSIPDKYRKSLGMTEKEFEKYRKEIVRAHYATHDKDAPGYINPKHAWYKEGDLE